VVDRSELPDCVRSVVLLLELWLDEPLPEFCDEELLLLEFCALIVNASAAANPGTNSIFFMDVISFRE
jgi:hypothetical protein